MHQKILPYHGNKMNAGELFYKATGKSKKIDLSEALRVFGELGERTQETTKNEQWPMEIVQLKHKTELLEQENKHLQERLDREVEIDKETRQPKRLGWFRK